MTTGSISAARLDTLRHMSDGGLVRDSKWLGIEIPTTVFDAVEALSLKKDEDINDTILELLSMGLDQNRKNRPHHIKTRRNK